MSQAINWQRRLVVTTQLVQVESEFIEAACQTPKGLPAAAMMDSDALSILLVVTSTTTASRQAAVTSATSLHNLHSAMVQHRNIKTDALDIWTRLRVFSDDETMIIGKRRGQVCILYARFFSTHFICGFHQILQHYYIVDHLHHRALHYKMTQTLFSSSIGTRRRAGDHIVRQRDFFHGANTPATFANGPGTSPTNPPRVNNAFATTRRGLARLSVGTNACLRKLKGSCLRVANCVTSVGSRTRGSRITITVQ
ncbi:hypothetical protein P692DRAFT_201808053 [Suillus brevipes Sb2]|nr:hypothetical protein P692DRAFT_201808053 [Suillus brevipes Sb2]